MCKLVYINVHLYFHRKRCFIYRHFFYFNLKLELHLLRKILSFSLREINALLKEISSSLIRILLFIMTVQHTCNQPSFKDPVRINPPVQVKICGGKITSDHISLRSKNKIRGKKTMQKGSRLALCTFWLELHQKINAFHMSKPKQKPVHEIKIERRKETFLDWQNVLEFCASTWGSQI